MATLDDVARLSQVSAMTVSRVINNKGAVSEATQQRVMAAIRQLNYRPNLVARGLATCRTNSIGVVVSRLENPNYAVMVAGINRKAAEYGYDILLGNGEDPAGLIHSVNTLLNKQVDGLIILPEETRNTEESGSQSKRSSLNFYGELEQLIAAGNVQLPVVLVGDFQMEGIAGRVGVDYYEGARMAVKCLYEKGHRRIGIAAHEAGLVGIWGERQRGFFDAMQELGCPVLDKDVIYCPEAMGAAMQVGIRFFAGDDLPTALYCSNDEIALGFLNAAAQCGVRVPEQISLIGHDGSLYSQVSYPRLTTVSISPLQIGAASMEMIAECLNESNEPAEQPRERIIKQELIDGNSVIQR